MIKVGDVVLSTDLNLYLVIRCNPNGICVVTTNGVLLKKVHKDSLYEIENSDLFTIIPKFEKDSTINNSSARQMAAKILQDSPFENENYYDLEDHITNVLTGKESSFPELSFYTLSLKQNVQTIFYGMEDGLDLVDDDLDDQVMDDVIDDLMSLDDEPTTTNIVETLKFNIAYKKYVDLWYENHDEGEPACREEFYSNEYKDKYAMECMGLSKLMSNF